MFKVTDTQIEFEMRREHTLVSLGLHWTHLVGEPAAVVELVERGSVGVGRGGEVAVVLRSGRHLPRHLTHGAPLLVHLGHLEAAIAGAAHLQALVHGLTEGPAAPRLYMPVPSHCGGRPRLKRRSVLIVQYVVSLPFHLHMFRIQKHIHSVTSEDSFHLISKRHRIIIRPSLDVFSTLPIQV